MLHIKSTRANRDILFVKQVNRMDMHKPVKRSCHYHRSVRAVDELNRPDHILVRVEGANLLDFRLADNRIFLEAHVSFSLSLFLAFSIVNLHHPIRIPFSAALFWIGDVDFLQALDFFQDYAYVLNCDFASFISNEQEKFSFRYRLSRFAFIVRVDSSDRRFFFDVF
jgi:hypothetical protein